MKHLNLRIRGKVQGVFFRDTARDKAQGLGLAGFIQNEPDGSVYAEVEGEEKAVDDFLQWARTSGSPQAEVESVQTEEADPRGFDGFEVRF